jgi:kinesin family protein 2/24
MEDAADIEQEVYITICDLAGKSAFDLLASRQPVSILQDATGTTQLAGAVEHRVYEGSEMLDLLDEAASFRHTASTLKNDASSRSHSICRIRIKNKTSPGSENGLLYLVDLAGSEAARDVVQHGADRMRETREINMSLSVLKDCVCGKAELETRKRRPGVMKQIRMPVRQSTLTRVLKHVFDPKEGRACRTVVIACVNPSLADVGSSKNTLRYAEMLRVPIPQ